MKAALVHQVGALPEVGVVAEPAGETIEVLAAPINPIDLAVSRGVLATGHPELPYVPGCEAVGRTADGGLVWIFGGSLGRTSQGAIAERAPVGDAYTVDVPEGADAALAAGLGIAGLAGWLPFAWRAPLTGGEAVLILGATGSVGLVAVQAAKLLERPESSRPDAVPPVSSALPSSERTQPSASMRRVTWKRHSRKRSAVMARATSSTRCGASPRQPRSGRPSRTRRSSISDSRPARPLSSRRLLCASRVSRFSATRTSQSLRANWRSTTDGSSATPSPGRSDSTWSVYRSTRSPTRGAARGTAPA